MSDKLTYIVQATETTTILRRVEIEADSPEEALEIAEAQDWREWTLTRQDTNAEVEVCAFQCPDCTSYLTSPREDDAGRYGPNYCLTCDREVDEDDLIPAPLEEQP